MKKLFAISLIAMTAVTAANAEIASKAYVDQERDVAKQYTDTKVGNISTYGSATDVATAIANAIQGGTENAVTRSGSDAVGSATVPVYVNANGVVTPTTLGTMALEAAADYTKTGLDTTYAKQSDFTTLQSAVNDASTGLAATKAIADANKSAIENATTGLAATKTIADAALPEATYNSQVGTVSSANMGTTATTVVTAIKELSDSIGDLGDTYATDAEVTTALSEYTKTGLDTTYAKASDFTTLQSAVNDASTGLAATKAIADANKTAIGDASSGLTKGVADNASAIAAINNATTGILATAESYTDTQLADYTPTANLGALATKNSVGTSEIDANAVTLAKLSATLPSGCQASGAECVLKSSNGALAWEVIQRATGE